MARSRRIVRPEPERTQPIRSGGFFGRATPPEGGAGERPRDGEREAPGDPLGRAIESGYRVVEEYIRQGEQAAGTLRGRGPRGAPLGADLQDLATRWLQYTSEMSELWLQLVGLAASAEGLRPAPPPPAPEPEPSSAGRAGAEPERVALTLRSRRPVEVTVDLRPLPPQARLRVHDLREVDPDKPRIRDVTFTRLADGAPALSIGVGDEQPVGTYSGAVLDEETSLPVGTVAVRVL